jgi:hypothetical protein
VFAHRRAVSEHATLRLSRWARFAVQGCSTLADILWQQDVWRCELSFSDAGQCARSHGAQGGPIAALSQWQEAYRHLTKYSRGRHMEQVLSELAVTLGIGLAPVTNS